MKGLLNKIEILMTASAFAEEGEFKTARQIMMEKEDRPRKTDRPSTYEYKRQAARPTLRAD